MPWIWLNEKQYPEYQHSFYNILADCENKDSADYNYCVADFRKTLNFNKTVNKITLRVSADSFFHLYINGELKGIGPAASGGDFLCRRIAPKHYFNNYEFECDSESKQHFWVYFRSVRPFAWNGGGSCSSCTRSKGDRETFYIEL